MRWLPPVIKYGLMLLVSSGISLTGYAKQLDFQRIQQADQWLFSYTWLDQNKHKQYFRASLNAADIAKQRRMIRDYEPFQLVAVQRQALHRAERNLPPNSSVTIRSPRPGSFSWQLLAPRDKVNELGQQLQQAVDDATQDFYHQRYLVEGTDNFGTPALLIDYQRVFNDSKAAVAPFARQFSDPANDPKRPPKPSVEAINKVLSWVQSIPYKTLDAVDRADDFLAPAYLAYRNEGDCDAKTILAAALLAEMYPSLPTAIILLPKHAVLGIILEQKNPLGRPLKLDDYTFTLAETAGPGLFSLGEVSDNSERLLDQGVTKAIWLTAPPPRKKRRRY